MFRAIVRHIMWLAIVLGTGFYLYENWRATGSRLELVTLILIAILLLRMFNAAERGSGPGVSLISLALACLASPIVGAVLVILLGHFHQPLSRNRQWGLLIVFAIANFGLRPKGRRVTAEHTRPSRSTSLVRKEPPDPQAPAAPYIYRDARSLFEIALPACWKEDSPHNAVMNAAFAREVGRAEITFCIGPVDLRSGQFAQSVRVKELRRLTWMEKERNVSSEPFGPYENAARGTWTLDAGRDWGPRGTERWPVASRRGLISIVTGSPENATEWVIQYRTEHDYIAEVTGITSSLRILNEEPSAAGPLPSTGH